MIDEPTSDRTDSDTDTDSGDAREVRWQARFRAARISFPQWAWLAPQRSIFVSNASGTFELYAWNRETGEQNRLTNRPAGTVIGAIDPTGTQVWWFDDEGGNEFGVWRRQPFERGPAQLAVPGLEASYPAGLALGFDGTAVVGRSTDDGSAIHLARPGDDPVVIYRHREEATVAALSRDGRLLAYSHSEHGDSRHPALRVVRLPNRTGDSGDPGGSVQTVAELSDAPGLGLEAIGFAPIEGDPRLLVLHERQGRWLPLLWDVESGLETDLRIGLPGDVSAQWYPDASALLIGHDHHARSELYRYDLAAQTLNRLDTPPGTIAGAGARPDGTVEFLWSSAAQPPAVRDLSGRVVLAPPGAAAPQSVPVSDAWVDGPGGQIHALICGPDGAGGPLPGVVMVHGGPTSHDTDSFSAAAAAWVDAGFVVVRVNYRGSTGYGSAWRDAIEHRVGLTELEDIRAVRDWAVGSGLIDGRRVVLAGASWGGYLTLLGAGVAPAAWSVAIASVPVADYVAAYEDEMEALRAFDRSLFGGTPADVPERYEQSSPISYVDSVTAPLLVMAGENDPRCPIRQIENYLERLRARSATLEVYRFDAGHGSLVVEERIRQVAAELAFARAHLPH